MHRISKLYTFSLTVVLAFASISSAQDYPWRSSTNGTIGKRASASRVQRRTSRQPVLVSFGRNLQDPESLADQQPSVSDVPATEVPQAPTEPVQQVPVVQQPQSVMQPGIAPTMIQPVPAQDWASPEPGLMIASNAGQEPNYCDRNCRKPCCVAPERELFPRNCNGLKLGGWTNLGYHNRDNGLLNNDRGDVQVHQVWLFADKQANRSSSTWNFGFRTDLLYGLDGQELQAFGNSPTGAPSGWDNSWDYGSYGWAMPQAYVQMANCNWDIKLGKFLAPVGYETIAAPNNFFYSHSFTRVLTEPQTMSGVLAERTLDYDRSIVLGATAGWDTGFDNNDGGNLILGFRRRANEFVDFAFTALVGDSGYRDTGIFTSGVTTVQLTNDIQYVLQVDNLNLRDNQEFGIVQYMLREVNPCLGLGARLEWWKSDRFFGGPNRSTYNFTMGANYRVNGNLRIRPELRFDWGALAVDPGQPIIGIDAVMTF